MSMIVTFGEIMCRLAPPDHLRLRQARTLDVTYAGAEASVAASICFLGGDARTSPPCRSMRSLKRRWIRCAPSASTRSMCCVRTAAVWASIFSRPAQTSGRVSSFMTALNPPWPARRPTSTVGTPSSTMRSGCMSAASLRRSRSSRRRRRWSRLSGRREPACTSPATSTSAISCGDGMPRSSRVNWPRRRCARSCRMSILSSRTKRIAPTCSVSARPGVMCMPAH